MDAGTAERLHTQRSALTARPAVAATLRDAMDTALDVPRVALALVEAQVGSLVDVLPVAILVADRHGQVLRANKAAFEVLEQAVLVGCSIDDVLRRQSVEVRQRYLVHADDVLRLFVVHPR